MTKHEPKNPIEAGRGPEEYGMGADANGIVHILTPEQYMAGLIQRTADEADDGEED